MDENRSFQLRQTAIPNEMLLRPQPVMFDEKILEMTGTIAWFSSVLQLCLKVDLAQAPQKDDAAHPCRVPLWPAGCLSWHFAAISPLKQLFFPPTPLPPQRTL